MIPDLANFNYIREIPNYPGYFVTIDGKVWSTRTNKGHSCRWLKLKKLNKGHLYVRLNHKHNMKLVHRLVLETFIGPCPDGMECCHYDGNPENNKLSNLRWDTHSNNQKDKVRHGRWKNPTQKGEKHPRAKLTKKDVMWIRNKYYGGTYSQRKLAKMFGIGKTTVAHIVNKDSWKHIK